MDKKIKTSAGKQKGNRITAGIIGASAVLLVIAGTAVYNRIIVPDSRYREGLSALETGEYKDALKIFEEMGDYRDSEVLALECRYDLAVIEFNKGRLEEALEVFDELGDLWDCKALAGRCRYDLAREALDDHDTDLALQYISELGDQEGVQELYLDYMTILMERRDYSYLNGLSEGDRFVFGEYDDMPLVWHVLQRDGNGMFVILDTYIGDQIYDGYSTAWTTSDIRNWLARMFPVYSFGRYESDMITECIDTGVKDSLFLLAEEDLEVYFGTQEERTEGFGHAWWLRGDAGSEDGVLYYVNTDGEVCETHLEDLEEYAVRPVMHITLE